MRIKVWGARGSLPTPLKPGEVRDKIKQAILGLPAIDTSDPAAVDGYLDSLPTLLSGTAGGNTTCIEIQSGGDTFIIDAGSGLRELGLELMNGPCGKGQGVLHFFFTHAHWDHLMGFPFFVPAFVPGNKLIFYSIHNINFALERQQEPISFPVPLSYMQASMEFNIIEPGQPFTVGEVEVNTIQTAHPGNAYAYRFVDKYGTFVFASDAEYKQLDKASLAPFIEFYKGADILFFDAQYTLREAWQKIDWGHSSALIGTDIARDAGVKKLVLVHHDPTYTDADLLKIQQEAQTFQNQDTTRPQCEVIVAYEGQIFNLTPPGTVDLRPLSDAEEAVLTSSGTIDEQGIVELERQLQTLLQSAESSGLVIDLSQTPTLGTAGLQALVNLRKKRPNTPIVLAAPSKEAQRAIELAGFADYFALYPTVSAAQTAIQAVSALNLPGHLIDNRYQIEQKVADTQQGGVYKAIDTISDRPVAIKVISASFGSQAVSQFLAQAQHIINFNHPHIVRIFDSRTTTNFSYIVEEFTELRSLGEVLAENPNAPLPPDQAREISLSILSALEYAHSRGVIHTNLSAHNILLSDKARLKNFGRGRLEEGRTLLGRPLILLEAPYLAPEQINGQPPDARTDLYALGVIMYQMFTGQLPFSGSEQAILQAHLNQPPSPPHTLNPKISRSLEYLILKLLAKTPAERHATAHQASQIFSNIAITEDPDMGLASLRYPDSRPLVGRQDELAHIQAIWQRVRQAQIPDILLLRGELGIGKSRLMAEFVVKDVVDQGFKGFVVHCDEYALPYGPFAQALFTIFNNGLVEPQEFSDQIPFLVGQIPALAPVLGHHQSPARAAIPANIQRAQWHFFEAVLNILTELGPTVIVLDDAEYIDEASISLIRYLTRKEHLPLLMLVAGRDDEETPPWFNAFQTNQNRMLSLPSLSDQAAQTLMTSIMGGAVSEPVVAVVQQRSHGNPYFIEEVTRHLMEAGELSQQADGLWTYAAHSEGIALPPTLLKMFARRVEMLAESRQIENLTEATRQTLTIAAVIGAEFDFKTWLAVLGGETHEASALNALDEALGLRLLRQSGGGRYVFDPPDLVDVLTLSLPREQEKDLHRQIAEILRQRNANPALISQHYEEAGMETEAAQYLEIAGNRAMSADAINEAVGYFKQAVSLKKSQASYEMLGNLYRKQGAAEESVQAFQQALQLARQANDISGQARILNGMALVFWYYDRYHEAEKVARDVLKLPDVSKDELAAAESHLGMIAWMQGHLNQAEDWCRQALETLQQGADEERIAEIHNRLGLVLLSKSEYAEATRMLNYSLGIRRKLDDYWGQAYCMNNLGKIAIDQGNYHQARFFFVSAQELFEEIDSRDGLMVVFANQGRMWLRQGEAQKGLTILEQALKHAQQLSRPGSYNLGDIYTLIASAKLALNDLEQAKAAVDEALLLVEPAGNDELIATAHYILAQIYDRENRPVKAEQAYKRAINLFQRVGYLSGKLRAQQSYAHFLQSQNQPETATKLKAAVRTEAAGLGLVL